MYRSWNRFTAIHYIKTAKRKPTGVGLAQLIDVDRSTARRMFKKILADLEIDRYNSLSAQIYEYNRQLERFWFWLGLGALSERVFASKNFKNLKKFSPQFRAVLSKSQ